MKRLFLSFLFCFVIAGFVTELKAEETKLSVAVLDFAAKDPGNPELGKQVAEAITVSLTGQKGLKIVERSSLTKTLQEHELKFSGMVDTATAVQVGKIVGARILVLGKVFPLGNKMILTAKLIGTETTLVSGVLVKGKVSDDLSELVLKLADKISERLAKEGRKLVAKPEVYDNSFEKLRNMLAEKKKPTVAVIIIEKHNGQTVTRKIDPAAETEIKRMLLECKIPVQDITGNKLAKWSSLYNEVKRGTWPQGLEGVDYIVTGEAFSEFSTRIGNLISCAGRVEINMISRDDGKILLSVSEVARNVDLSEGIAGKGALQKSAHAVGLKVLQKIVEKSENIK